VTGERVTKVAVELQEREKRRMEGKKKTRKKVPIEHGRRSFHVLLYSWFSALDAHIQGSKGSELGQAQDDVGQQSRDEDERKDGRAVFVVIPPLGAPRPQPQLSVNENDGGVCDGGQSRQCEHRRGNQAVGVTWFDEVKEGCSDRTNVDREVKPFL
jgi:hypothetical protein